VYYTVIKDDRHLKTRVFSNVGSVLSQCNTQLRLLHLLYNNRGNVAKNALFYVLHSDKKWVFDQSECVQGPTCIYIIHDNKSGS